MYEDEPQDKVHDVLATAIFGDHPLGRPVIGRAEVIGVGAGARHRRLPRRPLRRPRTSWWRRRAASSTTASWSSSQGALDGRGHAAARPPAPEPAPAALTPQLLLPRRRTPSSTTCASARPGCARGDERRFALRVLDTILGGSSPRGCSRRCARSAAWPTPSTRTPASSSTRARWASTWAPAPTTWPRRWT